MRDHINQFESIRRAIEFHSAQSMSKEDVNVALLISLGDSDTWKNYGNANLYRAIDMKTVDLIAEITIIDDSNTDSSTPSSSEAGRATSFP